MGRIIIVALACVVGVFIGLMTFTVVTPVGVNPDMPVFERTDLPPVKLDSNGKMGRKRSEASRRARAQQLLGEPMEYIRSARLIVENSIVRQGPEAMDRAMDECYLLTDETLFAIHVKKAIAAGLDEGEVGHPFTHVTKEQLQSCENVARAHERTHD